MGRWFEELCRIKHHKLRELVVSAETSLRSKLLPQDGGVYVFWWTGDLKKLYDCNREIILAGPGGRNVKLHFNDEWFGFSAELPIPLYVGKNADSISKRVGSHLRLAQNRMLPLGGSSKKVKPPTTSCQLRAGIEHLFPDEQDSRTLILDNIGLSFVKINGDIHAANRFYLEDLAIGKMRPVFNVDIER